ncbi:MAG: YesL family protein [Lachnospiraceae bacterium]|nr:YesL family protein [Lachnospiraceae bacterium]
MSGEGRGFAFLQMDSPFMRFLSVLADLMILNFLTILGCIPVITAGASFTAMHYVLTKMVRNEEGYIARSFFHAFKQNLGQSIFIWIGMIGVTAALVMDWLILKSTPGQFSEVLVVLLYAAAIVVYLIMLYVFPVLSRYHNTIRGTLKTAFSMAVFGIFTLRTIANGLLFLVPFAVLWIGGWNSIPILAVFCFTLPGYLRAALYSGLFKKYETPAEELQQQAEDAKKKREERKKNRNRFH